MNRNLKYPLLAAVMGLALAGTGCATQPKIPEAQFATTKAAIVEAEEAGGRTVASREMRTADQHFDAAKREANDGNYTGAMYLAEKAEADAKLAEARAEAAEAQKSARELQESIRLLRRELERQLSQ